MELPNEPKEPDLPDRPFEDSSQEIAEDSPILKPIDSNSPTNINVTGSESVQIELSDGRKFILGSSILRVDALCDLILLLIQELKNPTENGKGSYLG